MRSQVSIQKCEPLPEGDVLILPTNDYLWMGAGPGLAVKQAAGEEVELEAVRSGPIALGEIAVTGSGRLGFSGIIHAAVMGQDLLLDEKAAQQALQGGLAEATDRGWGRILIHSFLNAARGTPRQVATPILGRLVELLLAREARRVVTLLAVDDAERAVLHEAMIRVIQTHG